MSIGLQAIQLSPYHAGLAEQRRKRLLPSSALSACSCPLTLSGSGEPLPQGSPLNPSQLRWGCCMTYCGAPDAGGSQLQPNVGRGSEVERGGELSAQVPSRRHRRESE